MSKAEAFFESWPEQMKQAKEHAPDVVRSFGGMFAALMKDGALSVREKELIALGVGLAEQCSPCINLHVQKAMHAGATREQVIEAAGVVVMMRGGPAYTHVPDVIDAIDAVEKEGK